MVPTRLRLFVIEVLKETVVLNVSGEEQISVSVIIKQLLTPYLLQSLCGHLISLL